jgi:hypothetical protein
MCIRLLVKKHPDVLRGGIDHLIINEEYVERVDHFPPCMYPQPSTHRYFRIIDTSIDSLDSALCSPTSQPGWNPSVSNLHEKRSSQRRPPNMSVEPRQPTKEPDVLFYDAPCESCRRS